VSLWLEIFTAGQRRFFGQAPHLITRPDELDAELLTMLHHLGILLQICAMTFLPLVILYQLNFGFRLIAMPVCTVIGFAVFWIGTQLREKA
jgi:hypothetical protein